MQQTILLTGATGFLGSYLLEALLVKGHKVVILKRSTSNVWRIEHLMSQVISYDVDLQPLELAFKEQQIDCVMHTACHYGRNGDSIAQIVETNLMFGLHVLDACLKYDTKVFFNTDTLLHKNLNIYTLSKKQFVDWLEQNSDKIQVVNLKLEHMYGPKDDTTKFVPWILSQLIENVPEIKLTKGEQFRDFIYIDDVVSAYLTTLENLSSLESFNNFEVGSGNLVSVKDFLDKIVKSYQTNIRLSSTKLNFGAIPYRVDEMMTVELNSQPLIDLGWKPNVDIDLGIITILKAYRL